MPPSTNTPSPPFADPAIAALRSLRTKAQDGADGAYAALFKPEDVGGLSLSERALAALSAATLSGGGALADHYADLAQTHRASSHAIQAADRGETVNQPARLSAILTYVRELAADPQGAAPDRLRRLETAGLDTQAIVVLSQLTAFVTFQARLGFGLQALAQSENAA